eukprot:scaffold4642_cov112-Cylindrotheca_fusiformis.AAC.5
MKYNNKRVSNNNMGTFTAAQITEFFEDDNQMGLSNPTRVCANLVAKPFELSARSLVIENFSNEWEAELKDDERFTAP